MISSLTKVAGQGGVLVTALQIATLIIYIHQYVPSSAFKANQ